MSELFLYHSHSRYWTFYAMSKKAPRHDTETIWRYLPINGSMKHTQNSSPSSTQKIND